MRGDDTAAPQHLSPSTRAARGRRQQRTARGRDARLAHDVRQPLTSIRMNLQAAARLLHGRRPRVRAALEAIDDCLAAQHELATLVGAGLLDRSSERDWAALGEVPILHDLERGIGRAE